MRTAPIILLSCGLAALAHNRLRRSRREWYRNLKGWQKLFGLLGDSTFFDMLALALSVQMLASFQLAWRKVSAGFVRGLRWLGIPSPGFRVLLAAATLAVTGAISALQKITHHFFKDDL